MTVRSQLHTAHRHQSGREFGKTRTNWSPARRSQPGEGADSAKRSFALPGHDDYTLVNIPDFRILKENWIAGAGRYHSVASHARVRISTTYSRDLRYAAPVEKKCLRQGLSEAFFRLSSDRGNLKTGVLLLGVLIAANAIERTSSIGIRIVDWKERVLTEVGTRSSRSGYVRTTTLIKI
ncbi:hypothetical protein C8R44DRAFT_754609 [Mycena epipterygia]|nr:hypothetical protein C8R44DRAFT_754609 [Mycena epipterygia]